MCEKSNERCLYVAFTQFSALILMNAQIKSFY